MKIVLLAIGKTDQPWLAEAVEVYQTRLKHYIPFEWIILPDIKNTRKLSEEQQKEEEGKALLKSLSPGDCCILLDERGVEYTSVQFASYIEKKTHTVPRRLVFIIGGPYGFSREVYGKADGKISLSRMTFSHQMIRLLFIEQLYRALTILHNEPYHHE